MSSVPSAPPRTDPLPSGIGLHAIPWDTLARAIPLVVLLLPLAGALHRTIAFSASGRVPPGLGAAAPPSELVLVRVDSILYLVAAVGAAIIWWRYSDDLKDFLEVQGSYARWQARARRAGLELPPERRVRTEPPAVDLPVARGKPRLRPWRVPADEAVPDAASRRARVSLSDLAIIAAVVAVTVLGPTWVLFWEATLLGLAIAGIWFLAISERPSMLRLVSWAVFVALLLAFAGGLAPQTTIARTVEVDFDDDSSLRDGRYSYLGSDGGWFHLLECSAGGMVVRVPEGGVASIRYVEQPAEPWADSSYYLRMFVETPAPYPGWTPLWDAVLNGKPWLLGYIQLC